MRKTVYLCLTTVVLAATALAQSISTTQAQQDEKVVVGTNLVTLNVIVTDSKGSLCEGSFARSIRRLRQQGEAADRPLLRTLDAQLYAIGIADPKMDQLAAYRRWFFEGITRQGGRRSFLLDSDAAIGKAVLAEMSRVSGGATYFPQTESESELAGICTQIALELRQQYTVGFYSKATDNNWHRVKVSVAKSAKRSDLTLTYREGYQIAPSGY